MTFSPDDFRHLQAASGWLDLGNWREANEELERITPALHAHPDVLATRWHVYSDAGHWELALVVAEALVAAQPEEAAGGLHRSYALHELKRTAEAETLLLPALSKFPREWQVPYNLACYACKLGDVDRARTLLAWAFTLGDAQEVRLAALDDPDLEALWAGGRQG